MKSLRIPLVEDDFLIGALLAEMLDEMGYSACGVETTEAAAVHAALVAIPDLMLTSHEAKAHFLATTPAGAQPSHFMSRLDDADFQIFYHAPVLVLISAATEGAWVVEDCTVAAENFMLGAYALGLASCWIGFALSYFKTPQGKAAFGLSDA